MLTEAMPGASLWGLDIHQVPSHCLDSSQLFCEDNLLLKIRVCSYIVLYFFIAALEAANQKIEELETEVDRIKEEKREQSLGK